MCAAESASNRFKNRSDEGIEDDGIEDEGSVAGEVGIRKEDVLDPEMVFWRPKAVSDLRRENRSEEIGRASGRERV